MNTLTKYLSPIIVFNSAVITILVLGFVYVKVNTHDPAPAFPQQIVEGYCKVHAPSQLPAVPCEKN